MSATAGRLLLSRLRHKSKPGCLQHVDVFFLFIYLFIYIFFLFCCCCRCVKKQNKTKVSGVRAQQNMESKKGFRCFSCESLTSSLSWTQIHYGVNILCMFTIPAQPSPDSGRAGTRSVALDWLGNVIQVGQWRQTCLHPRFFWNEDVFSIGNQC